MSEQDFIEEYIEALKEEDQRSFAISEVEEAMKQTWDAALDYARTPQPAKSDVILPSQADYDAAEVCVEELIFDEDNILKEHVGGYEVQQAFLKGIAHRDQAVQELISDIKYSLSNPVCFHKNTGSMADNEMILESIRELISKFESRGGK